MRAAKASPRQFVRPPTAQTPARHTEETQSWRTTLAFSAAFFIGYLVGIFAGKWDASAFGTALAAYYMDTQHFASYWAVLSGLLAAVFLQASFVMLCGFHACGIAFLAAFFAAKGALMGLCAACVFSAGGAKALIIHWLLTCLPDLSTFLLLLWLALPTCGVCDTLFRCVFGGTAHISLSQSAKRLLLRYLMVLCIGVPCCLIGAGAAVLFAGVLL